MIAYLARNANQQVTTLLDLPIPDLRYFAEQVNILIEEENQANR